MMHPYTPPIRPPLQRVRLPVPTHILYLYTHSAHVVALHIAMFSGIEFGLFFALCTPFTLIMLK